MKYIAHIIAILAVCLLGYGIYLHETGRVVFQAPASTSTTTTITAPVVQDPAIKQQVTDISTKVDQLTTAVGNLVANQQPQSATAASTQTQATAAPTQTASTPTTDGSVPDPGTMINSGALPDNAQLPAQAANVPDQVQHHYFTNGVKKGPNGEVNPGKWVCGNGERLPDGGLITRRVMNADGKIFWLYAGFWDVNKVFHPFPADQLIDVGTPPEGYPMGVGDDGSKVVYHNGQIVPAGTMASE